MTQGRDGTWQVEVDEAGDGTDYAFALDGGEPLPDPRSAWQPRGVHGPSRVVRPRPRTPGATPAGAGRDARSARSFYELHVGTFTPEGTFDAAIAGSTTSSSSASTSSS